MPLRTPTVHVDDDADPARAERSVEGELIAPGRTALKLLGSSKTHEVFMAWDEAMLTLVAAKLVTPRSAEDRRARRALEREATALAQLPHPALPRCFDVALDVARPHIALELIEGPRLSTVIRRQRVLSVEQIVPLALQLCSAIHFMAERGMVHLDLKPKNVIMAPPPRLIDLSIARSIVEAGEVSGPIGTDRYMAPEQCGDETFGAIGAATDVWGLGATLFEALSGTPAFPPGDPSASGPERFPQLVLDPGELPRHAPQDLTLLIRGALERRASDRPTAAEIVHELDPIAEATPPRALLGKVRVSAWRRPKRDAIGATDPDERAVRERNEERPARGRGLGGSSW